MSVDDADAELFQLLNGYVESLRNDAGETGEPSQALTDAVPELAGLLDCLDSLESLAPAWSLPPQDFGTDATAASQQSAAGNGLRSLSSYDLLEEIGRGGMGIVYRAQHRTLGSTAAIKMIRADRLASTDEIRRFYREARAAAALSHPGIVRVHDVGESQGQHFLVMDHIAGINLSEHCRTEKLSFAKTAELVSEMARSVQFLHEQGIIHRDLKPSNILIDADGHTHLTDFGLAKVLTDSTETTTGTILGTPSYMSPEQAAGQSARVTERSDIYSLGAILYALLTGEPPFQEENPLDTLLGVLEREPALPRRLNPAVPHELQTICLRCLEKDPERRYQSAAALADDLERWQQGEPIAAVTSGWFRRLRKWVRREPALASRLIAVSIALTIIQINWFGYDSGTTPNHWWVVGLLTLWGATSFVLQQLLMREGIARFVPYVWTAVDILLFTELLRVAEGPAEALLAGYPMLIAASGLWFRVRLVTFMTACSFLSFASLWLFGPYDATLNSEMPSHYIWLLAVMMLATGSATGYQVYRIRILDKYFEQRRLHRSYS